MEDLYRAKLTHSPPVVRRQLHPETMELGPGITIKPQPPDDILPSHTAPIPIHLPNIYVNPYPTSAQPAAPSPLPAASYPVEPSRKTLETAPVPSFAQVFKKPHPLLWLSLLISLTALILGVPKGSLPTLTGRHKELRVSKHTP